MAGGELKIKASVDANGVKAGVSSAKQSITGFGRTLQTAMGMSLHTATSRFVSILKDAVVESVKIYAQFERIELTLGKLMGSKAGGSALMGQLRDFSVSTPFTPKDVFKASKLLMSFGFAAREQIGILRTLGDAASVSGKPLEELAFIYGKVFSRGRAQAREMNQLIRAQIPITREVAKVMGVTESEVKDLTTQGKVGFKEIQQALKNLTGEGGQFYRMTEDSSRTMEGRFSTLVGVLADVGAKFAAIFSPELMSSMNWFIKKLDHVKEVFEGLAVMKAEKGGLWWALAKSTPGMVGMAANALKPDKPFGVGDPRQGKINEIQARINKGERVHPLDIVWMKDAQSDIAKKNKEEAERLSKANKARMATMEPGVDGSSSGNKILQDKFFQQGQFMFNPSNMPMVNVQERQLSVLEQIAASLFTISPGQATNIIMNSASQTFNQIRNGVGVD